MKFSSLQAPSKSVGGDFIALTCHGKFVGVSLSEPHTSGIWLQCYAKDAGSATKHIKKF